MGAAIVNDTSITKHKGFQMYLVFPLVKVCEIWTNDSVHVTWETLLWLHPCWWGLLLETLVKLEGSKFFNYFSVRRKKKKKKRDRYDETFSMLNRHPFKTTGLTIDAHSFGVDRHHFSSLPDKHLLAPCTILFPTSYGILPLPSWRVHAVLYCRIYNCRKFVQLFRIGVYSPTPNPQNRGLGTILWPLPMTCLALVGSTSSFRYRQHSSPCHYGKQTSPL
jgi:hypothetical protein